MAAGSLIMLSRSQDVRSAWYAAGAIVAVIAALVNYVKLAAREEVPMTNNERDLVAVLEADIQKWEFVAGLFERHLPDIETVDGRKMTVVTFAAESRRRIAEHRELIEKVKKG
jgi:hypothetical protein